ncbi:MAG: hypothetical protein PHU85_18165, partial [Phycisphaerae bacterium]|nr:hypothetical protein [Phycisphaerae bacterium]
MAERYSILNRLVAMTGPAVEDALLRAIDLSDPDEQQPLVNLMLDRAQPRGLLGLVARFHNLPGPLRDRLRERAEDLAAGIKAGIASDTHQTRANALSLISSGRYPSLAIYAAMATSDVDRGLADQAAEATLNFVNQYLARTPVPPPADGADPTERTLYDEWRQTRQHIVVAVRTALASFHSHHRTAPLECAVRLADELADVLRPFLEQPNNDTSIALQDLATSSIRLG